MVENTDLPDVDEPESLDDIDLGLDDQAILDIAANERWQCAVAYQTLHLRLLTVEASIKANQNVGNIQAVKQFESQLEEISRQEKHALRGIKTIDKRYPEAKARMLKNQGDRKR